LDRDHPAVAERAQEVALARARTLDASTLENPTLGLEQEDLEGPGKESSVTLSWQIPESSRRLEIGARRQATGAAEARLSESLASLRLEMREVYAEWALATARRDQLSIQAVRIEELADREVQRAEKGEASGLEARRLTLAAVEIRARVALADAVAEGARGQAMGWNPELPLSAEPVLPFLLPMPRQEEEPPQLQAARADVEAALLEQKVAGRFVRSPEVTVGWKREEGDTEAVDGPILGIGWSVPLFSRKQSDKAAATARLTAARARLETVQRDIDSSRRALMATYQQLATALVRARDALDGSEQMLAGAEAAFRHGEGSLTDLLDTLRLVSDAETAKLDLFQEALAAHRELEGLAGYHGALNSQVDSTSDDSLSEELTP